MSKTYSKQKCPTCGRMISHAGGAYWRHVEKCKTHVQTSINEGEKHDKGNVEDVEHIKKGEHDERD